jgi:hypothetical protein
MADNLLHGSSIFAEATIVQTLICTSGLCGLRLALLNVVLR